MPIPLKKGRGKRMMTGGPARKQNPMNKAIIGKKASLPKRTYGNTSQAPSRARKDLRSGM